MFVFFFLIPSKQLCWYYYMLMWIFAGGVDLQMLTQLITLVQKHVAPCRDQWSIAHGLPFPPPVISPWRCPNSSVWAPVWRSCCLKLCRRFWRWWRRPCRSTRRKLQEPRGRTRVWRGGCTCSRRSYNWKAMVKNTTDCFPPRDCLSKMLTLFFLSFVRICVPCSPPRAGRGHWTHPLW